MKNTDGTDKKHFIIYSYSKEEKERIENIIKKYGYTYEIETDQVYNKNFENVTRYIFTVMISESSVKDIIFEEFTKEISNFEEYVKEISREENKNET